jgi:hypothetical protein
MWEDAKNKGNLDFHFELVDFSYKQIHNYWENFVFELIGENFINSEKVIMLAYLTPKFLDLWNQDYRFESQGLIERGF